MLESNLVRFETMMSVIYRPAGDRITAAEYEEAIRDLIAAKSQLNPDGHNCAVCHDSGHQAWECHHNPLVMARRAARSETQWRCFHCGTVCHTEQEAREHFGTSEEEVARCLAETAQPR